MKACNTDRANDGSRKVRTSTPDFLAAPAANGRIPTRWQWHRKTLLELHKRLLSDRREQFADVARQLEPHSMSLADSATDQYDHDVVLCELSARQNALFEIDEALSRIVNGTYGVCEETGVPIPEARLRAIPWTRFSTAVEARLEKKGKIRRPSLGLLRSLRETQRSRAAQKPGTLTKKAKLKRFRARAAKTEDDTLFRERPGAPAMKQKQKEVV